MCGGRILSPGVGSSITEKAAEIDRGICRKIHHENSEIPKALGKGKNMDKKHPKTQERTLPEIHFFILKILHQAFHFFLRFSATTIAKKFLTGMQPSLFKFLGRGHHTGKTHLISHLKCVWLNSIDQFQGANKTCQSLPCHHSWLQHHPTTSNPGAQVPQQLFFSPWAALTRSFPPNFASSLCSPQSMGIGVQLNQDLAELRAFFFAMRWNPITINGTTRMTTPRGFLGQNLSKKNEIPIAWHSRRWKNHTETRFGFHLMSSRQQRKIRGRSAMSPSASSSFPSFRSCLCRYTWQCSKHCVCIQT